MLRKVVQFTEWMTQMEMSTRSRFYFICILSAFYLHFTQKLGGAFEHNFSSGVGGGGNLNKKVIKSSKPEIYAGGGMLKLRIDQHITCPTVGRESQGKKK